MFATLQIATVRALGCASGLVIATLTSQARPISPDERDPYTRHDAAAMSRAGVVALQRFLWTADHTTADIQLLLGQEPLRCVETAHFRIVSSLAALPLPKEADRRARLRAELASLQGKLTNVDVETRDLDPWLRVHLYAHRLESMHADFAHRIGWRAAKASEPRFLVMLCRSGAHIGAYARNYLDLPAPRRTLRLATKDGAWLLAMAETMPEENFIDDVALHTGVIYHTAHLLLAAYRASGTDCPLWLSEGLAHWYRRRAHPEQPYFASPPRELPETPEDPAWPDNLRARVAAGCKPTGAALAAINDRRGLRFEHHLEAFARVDFLLRTQPNALPFLFRACKERPAATDDVAEQAHVLRAVFGWTWADFDARFATFIDQTYPRG